MNRKKGFTIKSLILVHKMAMKSNARAYIGLIILSLIVSANTYINLAFCEFVVSSASRIYSGSTDLKTVILVISYFTIALVLLFGIGIYKDLLRNRLILDLEYNFNNNLNSKLGKASWDYYENHSTFVKIHEVKEHSFNTIKNMLDSIIFYITSVPLALIYGYYLAQINFIVVIAYIILVAIFNLVIAGKMFSQLGGYWKEVQKYEQKQKYFFDISGDKITHQEFKFNRLFTYASSLWERYYNEEYNIKLKIFKKHEITLQTARIIFNIPYVCMMIYIAFEVIAGKHELGFIMMANILLNKIINTSLGIQRNINNNRVESVFVKTYVDIMELSEHECVVADSDKQDIIANDLIYCYPQSDVRALNHLSLTIKNGEKIAIVGHNGSGKTTFTNILMSLTKDYNGEMINNHSISCITQDFAQYQMTIKENIAVGYVEKEFEDEEIIELINKVGLKEKIMGLKDGIHTTLGQLQKGMELSKGQWQRIAIARLLANPNATVWILDEPTAYLDPISEIEIYNLIYDLAGERTVLFISHRLGFAKQADRIIVFEKGRVVEQGDHRLLIDQQGIYEEMYMAQESWYSA